MKRTLRRLVSPSAKKPISPLHPHVECFTRNLVGQGYSHDSVAYRHRLLSRLDPWLLQQGLNLTDLSEDRIEQFFGDRHEQYSTQNADKPALQAFLDYLRSENLVPHAVAKRTQQSNRSLAKELCCVPRGRTRRDGIDSKTVSRCDKKFLVTLRLQRQVVKCTGHCKVHFESPP